VPFKIPKLSKRRLIIQNRVANEIIKALNPLLNITIAQGGSDSVAYSKDGVKITVKREG
jgi:hypothetical protein